MKNNLPRTRPESALQIIRLILQAQANHFNLRNIIVLTPFVAQMKIIRNRLDDHGLYSVNTSTVHRTQGTERQVVIFDAVDGTSDFLSTDSAKRLINVALSRAQAKLILLFSETDRQNDLLRSISDIVERQQANRRTI
jgi:superfamily I DNA and/or RNA helicase